MNWSTTGHTDEDVPPTAIGPGSDATEEMTGTGGADLSGLLVLRLRVLRRT